MIELLQAISPNKYLQAGLIFILFFILAKIVIWLSEKIIIKFTSKTKTPIDDLIVAKINKPISFILIVIGGWLALDLLNLQNGFDEDTKKILHSLIVVAIVYVLMVVFSIIIDQWGKNFAKMTKSKLDDQLLIIIHKASKIIFILLGLIYILHIWGIQIGPILASLGIAGLAVAFALQNTLGNIFGGVSILLDKSVKVGDVIRLDEETYGTVTDVGLRSTKIRTWTNELIIIPNGTLANSNIKNYQLPDPKLRIDLEFGVEYGSDIDKVKKVAMDVIKKIDNVLKDPEPKVMFIEMGDFALKFRLMFWVSDINVRFETKEKANCLLYKALNKAKIGIPFPTRTVYMKR